MSFRFPSPRYFGGFSKLTQIKFGGYDHTKSCSEGGIYDMANLSADHYPVLSTRKKRLFLGDGAGMSLGYLVYDDTVIDIVAMEDMAESAMLYVTHFNGKYFSFRLLGHSRRFFAWHGDYLIIMPDKKYLRKDQLLGGDEVKLYDIEARVSSSIITIGDGLYGGLPAKANTVTFSQSTDLSSLRVGDAVRISGCTQIPENNKIAVIEEIDGNKLIFLENTFTLPEGKTEYTESGQGDGWIGESGQLILPSGPLFAREMPDLEYMCVQDNRLWGCKGDTIYASRLGDPLNFYNYEGAAGAWSLDVMSAGDFTGCTSYLGYVIFFKEDTIHKIYGDRPSNFSLNTTAAIGIKSGSGSSIARAGQVLFYHSRVGIMAYSGGVPRNISECFGDQSFSEAVGGSDGTKYYVSMRNDETDRHVLFVYDTESNLWMREDDTAASSICYADRLYIATLSRELYALSAPRAGKDEKYEEGLSAFAEFGDFYNSSPNKKAPGRLQARLELEEGARVSFFIKYDSEGDFKLIKEISCEGKRSYTLPIRLRRCDHYRIRIEGEGEWRLYSLAREGYTGSEK